MDEPGLATAEAGTSGAPVFISFASADRKQAVSVCEAVERRGTRCWLSSRDVGAGENYQEAIVRAIRAAPAMVLVFTRAANHSDEIKKELSLASRYRIPVLALRLDEVEPSDAFAYELATRQWIDGFDPRMRPLDALVARLHEVTGGGGTSGSPQSGPMPATGKHNARFAPSSRGLSAAVAVMLCGAAGLGGWLLMRPHSQSEHALTVRLAGFQLLSPDLPAIMRDTVGAEINAAFNADGVVGVSTAAAPPGGSGPAYALGGTIQRYGPSIRVIPRLTDERSGLALWSGTFDYQDDLARVPRHIAVDAGNIVRCGLFGASTYHKALPDDVMRDYLQFCQAYWDSNMSEGRKALVPAMRIVRAVPDFSWGWGAVAGAYWKVTMDADDPRQLKEAQVAGREAADRALALDPRNSEALYIKAMLMDPHDWLSRGELLKRAIEAQRLDCGCERHQYGDFLVRVGRVSEGVEQLRQANQMLALYIYTPLSLANALVAAGKPEEAREFFGAAAELAPDPGFAGRVRTKAAEATGNLKELADPRLTMSASKRAALLTAYNALSGRDSAGRAKAIHALRALTVEDQDETAAALLSALGAPADAFGLAQRLIADWRAEPTILWRPQMRAVLDQPGIPALLNQLGLLNYWRQTRTRPDVCSAKGAPDFCRTLQ